MRLMVMMGMMRVVRVFRIVWSFAQDLVRPHASAYFAAEFALGLENLGVEVRSWLGGVKAVYRRLVGRVRMVD